ncbi:hypothetical protein HDE_00524 [Halotydeus destructor]|nr:hypothetical protein HDE_00524 [Halotydeus destructor]
MSRPVLVAILLVTLVTLHHCLPADHPCNVGKVCQRRDPLLVLGRLNARADQEGRVFGQIHRGCLNSAYRKSGASPLDPAGFCRNPTITAKAQDEYLGCMGGSGYNEQKLDQVFRSECSAP